MRLVRRTLLCLVVGATAFGVAGWGLGPRASWSIPLDPDGGHRFINEPASMTSGHNVFWRFTSSEAIAAVNVGRKPGEKKPRWRITQVALDAFEAARASCPPPPLSAPRRRSRDDVIEFFK